MNPDVQRILSFWYDRNPMEWFRPPQGFDDECKSNFGDLIVKARAGDLDNWAAEVDGSLALIVLLDQLTRNVFRGSPDVYGGDTKAAERNGAFPRGRGARVPSRRRGPPPADGRRHRSAAVAIVDGLLARAVG